MTIAEPQESSSRIRAHVLTRCLQGFRGGDIAKGPSQYKLPDRIVAAGRKPSGFTTPDGLRRSAKTATYLRTVPNVRIRNILYRNILIYSVAIAALAPLPVWSQGRDRNAQSPGIVDIKYNLQETVTSQIALKTILRQGSFSWTNQPLREGLETLSKTFQMSVWLDRRLDPNQPITFGPKQASGRDASLFRRLQQIEGAIPAQVGLIENVIHIGPAGETERIQRAAVQLHDAISKQDQRLGGQSRQLSWPELATPQILKTSIETAWGISIDGELPHDLMHAGELLAPASLATQLTLLAAGFDLEVEVSGENQFRFIPLGEATRWKANYAKNSIDSTAYAELKTKYPGSQMQVRSNISSVLGPTNFHIEMFASKTPGRSATVAKLWTLEVKDPLPTSAILSLIAARLGVEVQWDATCSEAQRSRLQSLSINEAATNVLLGKVCDGADLSFTLDDDTLSLRSK